ncbi:UNVERIFIED_CONTAM: hypothetical protein GTU68_002034 [Idotea baltica]|nr:hypothetical protein [Idotea baltica]
MVKELKITKTTNSKLDSVDFNNIPFGHVFSDHMLVMDYSNGKWQEPQIIPFGDMQISPACSALHYGQSIFEGMKAERGADGSILFFRPEMNLRRLNESATRMGMPTINEEDFLYYLKELVKLDNAWIPTLEGSSLYIRPLFFGNDGFIGVRSAETFRLILMTGPAGPYYAKPVNVFVEDKYVRAVNGGTGAAKTAGNYAATLYPMQLAKEAGFDQILWTDAHEHKYLQEAGTMNLFFVIDGVVITSPLNDTILPGITRDSFITLLREKEVEVQERPISVDEVFEAHKNGKLDDAFGAGTAAVLIPIKSISTRNEKIELNNPEGRELSISLKKHFVDIKRGLAEDKYSWITKI